MTEHISFSGVWLVGIIKLDEDIEIPASFG